MIPDQSKPWVVNVSLDYVGDLPSSAGLDYKLMGMNNETVASGSLSNVTCSDAVIGGTVSVADDAVKKWCKYRCGCCLAAYLFC